MAASVWKGYISFGMVSIPVQLQAAARSEGIHFHMLHKKDLSRVKEVWYCAEEDKPIARTEIVKGYEMADGKYVTVEDAELKKIAPPTERAMEIIQFVQASDVDPIYFDQSYYISPGDAGGKPYTVFLKALEETKYSAIAKLSMHGREHPVLIRSSEGQLMLHRLFYAADLHKRQSAAPKGKPAAKEVALAAQLIKQLVAPFRPGEFHDTYKESVEKLLEAKQKGRKLPAAKQERRAPVIDLMEALKKSLAKKESAKPVKGRRKVA